MMNASHAAMQEALKQRRDKGLNLTIFLGNPSDTANVEGDSHLQGDSHLGDNKTDEKDEERELGHAPEGTPLDNDDKSMAGASPEEQDMALDGDVDDGELPAADHDAAKLLIEQELKKNHVLGRGSMLNRLKK